MRILLFKNAEFMMPSILAKLKEVELGCDSSSLKAISDLFSKIYCLN